MAIELVRLRNRKHVAWLREAPPEHAVSVFLERGFGIRLEKQNSLRAIACPPTELEDHSFLSGLRAVIFTQSESKPSQIVRDLERYARRLLDYDCRIVLRSIPGGASSFVNKIDELKLPVAGLPAQDAEKLRNWQNPRGGEPPLPYLQHFERTIPWNDIANFISESPAGPAPSETLKITIENWVDSQGRSHPVHISQESGVLLRRAFHDCAELHLWPLEGGRSGARVFRAYAELEKGLHGRWPQSYFVKVADRTKIHKEHDAYQGSVQPYVPFHLAPHLVAERCCLGATEGVLVGDYIEESESLRHCASDGRSASAVACLFDRTLLGWHRRATEVKKPLSKLLKFPTDIPEARMKKARELGATKNAEELHSLFKRCSSKEVLVGPVHGDLHAANVRVRATDAIVIDFFAHRQDRPLVCDAAALEASLLVEGFSDLDADVQKWLQSLKPLYDRPPFGGAPDQVNPRNQSFWFHASVHQIRRYARQWERGANQYAAALAVALLLKAKKDADAVEPEASRRAAAYVLAERLLVATFGAGSKPKIIASQEKKLRQEAKIATVEARAVEAS